MILTLLHWWWPVNRKKNLFREDFQGFKERVRSIFFPVLDNFSRLFFFFFSVIDFLVVYFIVHDHWPFFVNLLDNINFFVVAKNTWPWYDHDHQHGLAQFVIFIDQPPFKKKLVWRSCHVSILINDLVVVITHGPWTQYTIIMHECTCVLGQTRPFKRLTRPSKVIWRSFLFDSEGYSVFE